MLTRNYECATRQKEEEGEKKKSRKEEAEVKIAVMNMARIHDKHKLMSFWEQKIVQHSEQMHEEENRMRSSSLTRLREQWLILLNERHQHQQSFHEERIRRAQKAQQKMRKLDSP